LVTDEGVHFGDAEAEGAIAGNGGDGLAGVG
jgi:hypothetical protein